MLKKLYFLVLSLSLFGGCIAGKAPSTNNGGSNDWGVVVIPPPENIPEESDFAKDLKNTLGQLSWETVHLYINTLYVTNSGVESFGPNPIDPLDTQGYFLKYKNGFSLSHADTSSSGGSDYYLFPCYEDSLYSPFKNSYGYMVVYKKNDLSRVWLGDSNIPGISDRYGCSDPGLLYPDYAKMSFRVNGLEMGDYRVFLFISQSNNPEYDFTNYYVELPSLHVIF